MCVWVPPLLGSILGRGGEAFTCMYVCVLCLAKSRTNWTTLTGLLCGCSSMIYYPTNQKYNTGSTSRGSGIFCVTILIFGHSITISQPIWLDFFFYVDKLQPNSRCGPHILVEPTKNYFLDITGYLWNNLTKPMNQIGPNFQVLRINPRNTRYLC